MVRTLVLGILGVLLWGLCGLAVGLQWPLWAQVLALVAGVGCVVAGARGEWGSRRSELEALASLRADYEGMRERFDEVAARGLEIESLYQALREPILALDGAGRVLSANAAAGALLGLDVRRIRGRPVEEIFTQGEIVELCARARAGEPLRAEVRVARPEGFRMWAVTATPVAAERGARDGEALGAVVELRDITERLRSLQVKTDFVANASHELRTPIAAIRVAVDTLRAIEDDDPAMRERVVGMIASNTARLEEMVRDLLDLSRMESEDVAPEIERVDLRPLARDLQDAHRSACEGRKLSLAVEIEEGLEAIQTDRKLLRLILSNLIDNAVKFAFEQTAVRVVARRTQDGVRLEVIDQGIGIPLEHQERVFERYYQVEGARSGGARRGTGLGLAIVKHAVRKLGGSIRVESVWQQGTRMIVDLPRAISRRA